VAREAPRAGRRSRAGRPHARDLGPQASLGIQLGELVPWVQAHPIRGVITLLLAVGAVGTLLNPPIEALPNRLSAGDCISAPTAAAQQPAGAASRPIGSPGDVEEVINAGTAVRAACGLSHSHEVTAIMPVGLPGHGSLPPSGGGSLVPVEASPATTRVVGPNPSLGGNPAADADRLAIRASVQAVCDSAFEGSVGHPLAGSAYETFAVIPSVAQLETGPQLALCLVARADGQALTSPAKNSKG
jgi:hypothetical protein